MNKGKRVLLGVCLLAFVMAMLLGNTANAAKNDKKKIKSLSWKDYGNTLTIKKGEKIKLGVDFSPKKNINKTLTWKSSKKKVVTVSSKGVITGKKKGTATITAAATDGSNKKLKLKVTVGVKVSEIEFTNTSNGKMDRIYLGKTYTIKTSVKPSNASNKAVKWSSSDTGIARVDSKGVITPVANGLVMITAEAADGSGVIAEEEFEVATLVSSVSISCKTGTAYQVAINSDAACVKGGSSVQINASFSPEDATDKSLTYTSSNENVARVGSNGVVDTYDSGIAVITATANDGSKKSAKYTLYVNSLEKGECDFVAHRGYSELAPDNSLAAFMLAMAEGFDYVELDIWPTSDNQFAVCHNKSLADTTGDAADITNLTLAQVTSHKIIKGNGLETYPSEKIPSLEQVLALARNYPNAKFNIELKDTMSDDLLKNLLQLIDKYNLHDRVRLISFKKANLVKIRSLTDYGGDDIALGYLTHTLDQTSINSCVQLNAELGATYIQMSKAAVRIAHENGVKVNAWTVPDIYMAGYLVNTVKVDSITANYKFFK